MSDNQKPIVEEREHVVIKFAGDSGDGMQFTGIRFSETSAMMGNEVSTFPDYPAEIRAPKGTVGGVSGFQIHIGSGEVITPGDEADVLVALNPAALKANLRWVRKGGTIIVDIDTFTPQNLQKAGFESDPLHNGLSREYQVIEAPITTLTKEAVKDLNVDHSTALQSRNMFALGIVYWLFHRDLKYTEEYFYKKFKNKPEIAELNKRVLNAGYNYAMNIQLSRTYIVKQAKLEPGTYRYINGNIATAWGLLAAALPLVLNL
jgi:2-oxoglutarate ferredoxin oxidoreductase subunit alpha